MGRETDYLRGRICELTGNMDEQRLGICVEVLMYISETESENLPIPDLANITARLKVVERMPAVG